MLLRYCGGNLSVLQYADFSEIYEILDFLVTKENDETLLRAYQASYAALHNITFEDFKNRVKEKSAHLQPSVRPQDAQTVMARVEHYLNDFTWKEA